MSKYTILVFSETRRMHRISTFSTTNIVGKLGIFLFSEHGFEISASFRSDKIVKGNILTLDAMQLRFSNRQIEYTIPLMKHTVGKTPGTM